MIPKKIHYCWFGRGEKSDKIKACLSSWEKYLPDYEIMEWNEDTFDLDSNIYVKQAYEARKWAFVSDYVRLYALYHCGGIYMDTDVEVLKPFDAFLESPAFTGFETKDSPITAVFGSEKGNSVIWELLKEYEGRQFVLPDGSFDLTTNTTAITESFLSMGVVPNGKFQKLDNVYIYPQIYFCPNNFTRIWDKPSKKSYAIHHFEGSWKDSKTRSSRLISNCRRYLVGVLRNTVGTKRLSSLKRKNGE